MEPQEVIRIACDFLQEIGIPFEKTTLTNPSFLPGLLIDKGCLFIDEQQLAYPGDILHEAGHIALTDPLIRPELGQEWLDNAEKTYGGEEIGVILWSLLAARAIGIPEALVVHEGGYRGQSKWHLEQFGKGTYIGLPLLQWMQIVQGFTETGYPIVRKWLR